MSGSPVAQGLVELKQAALLHARSAEGRFAGIYGVCRVKRVHSGLKGFRGLKDVGFRA